MLVFSTCWNSHRHRDGGDMLREIQDLGFDAIELGHGVRLTLMQGVLKLVEEGSVKIHSLHNFCPLPVEIKRASPNCYEFSSHRQQDRDRALRLTKQTIDYASRLGARFVVVHLGTVRILDHSGRLVVMAKHGGHLNKQYAREKVQAVMEREKASAFYLDRVFESVKPIVDYAGEKGITLGFENRDKYEEIPSEREFPLFFERFPSAGYWHDFGHAQVKQNLGFLDHFEWLQKMGQKAVGCHLHDAAWPNDDHRAPFTGEIAFEMLVPCLPRGTPFVFEMNPKRTREEIVTSAEEWRRRYAQ